MAEGVCVKKNSFFVMQVTMNVKTTGKTEGGGGSATLLSDRFLWLAQIDVVSVSLLVIFASMVLPLSEEAHPSDIPDYSSS